MLIDITYKNGLMNPITVDAKDLDEAKRLGLAAYRKNCTMVSTVGIDDVIDTVTISSKTSNQTVV